jgi:hypothetical protein
LLAALLAKIPLIFNIDEEFFFTRNIGFIVFPILTTYFIWKNKLSLPKTALIAIATLILVIFINVFPADKKSDTLILSCIHLPLFLWSLLGFAFVGGNLKDYVKRLDFLRYNGDLIVLITIILIAGMLLTGITVGLFSLIGYEIMEFYGKYIAISGLAAAPIIATYLIRANPQLVNMVSPVVAKIFSPLVLITLIVYLIAIVISGKDPYNDRDFLINFNLLLIGVMAIIFFSVAETYRNNNQASKLLLLALSVLTIIVNCVALSAILFRISEWGITPNRLAVLGGNILILTNLLFVTIRLFKTVVRKSDTSEVEDSISMFLPVYAVWTVIVIFVFPFMFGFK